MVEGVLRARGIQNVGREIGMDGTEESVGLEVLDGSETGVGLEVLVDSSSAKSFVSRRGVGKMWHMEVRWLWLQEEVRSGRVEVTKVKGEWNPADLLTKYLTMKEIHDRLGWMGMELEEEAEAVVAQVRKEQRRTWWKGDGGGKVQSP